MTRVSSDALPALTGRRRVGAVQSGRISGEQGGTAEIVFSVLVPLGEQGLFLSCLTIWETLAVTEIELPSMGPLRSRQTMATPAGNRKPIQQSFQFQKGVFYYEKGYFSGSVRYDDAHHVRRMQGFRHCRNRRPHCRPHFLDGRRNLCRYHPRSTGIQRRHRPAAGSRFSG